MLARTAGALGQRFPNLVFGARETTEVAAIYYAGRGMNEAIDGNYFSAALNVFPAVTRLSKVANVVPIGRLDEWHMARFGDVVLLFNAWDRRMQFIWQDLRGGQMAMQVVDAPLEAMGIDEQMRLILGIAVANLPAIIAGWRTGGALRNARELALDGQRLSRLRGEIPFAALAPGSSLAIAGIQHLGEARFSDRQTELSFTGYLETAHQQSFMSLLHSTRLMQLAAKPRYDSICYGSGCQRSF